jgi:hypothetical protein
VLLGLFQVAYDAILTFNDPVVAAALVVGIGPDFLAKKHPTPAIALTHDVFSTGVVETVKEFGFKG